MVYIKNKILQTQNKTLENKKLQNKKMEKTIKKICLFDKNKKLSFELVEILFFINEKKIARELLECNLLAIDINIFRVAIINKDFKLALFFYKSFKDLKLFEYENLHLELIENLNFNLSCIEYYLYFIRMTLKHFTIRSAKFLIKVCDDILCLNKKSFVNYLSNPFKQLVLLAEVLKKLKYYFNTLEYHINNHIVNILKYCGKIEDIIQEDNLFFEMIQEKDLDNRPLINIISKNNFLELLRNNLVEKTVDDMWDGPYLAKASFFEVSSNYNNLKTSLNCKDYDSFTKQRNSLLNYKSYLFKTNFTHFKVWRKNTNIKFYFELSFNLIFLFIFLAITVSLIDQVKIIINLNPNVFNDLNGNITYFLSSINITDFKNFDVNSLNNNTLIENLTAAKDLFRLNVQVYKLINKYFFYLMTSMYIFMTIPVSYIIRFIFYTLSHKPSYGLGLYPDSALFFLTILVKLFWKTSFINADFLLNYNSLNDFDYSFLTEFYKLQIIVGNEVIQSEFILFSIFSMLLFMKSLITIKGTKIFGPIIIIFLLTVKGIFFYIITYIGFNMIGAVLGYFIFFKMSNDFAKNIFYTFSYYFYLSLGNDPQMNAYIDDPISVTQTYIPYVFIIFIILFLISNMVIFFNLVIALLSNIYEIYYSQSIQLYIQQKLEIRRKFYTEDKRYDSLLSSNFPFDIILLPFAILFIITKNPNLKVKYNKIISSINFFFFVLIYTSVFALFTFLMIPFSYLWVILVKSIQIFIDDIQEYYKIYKISSLTLYVIFGPIFHIKAFFIDLIIFIKQSYRTSVPFSFETDENYIYYVKLKNLKNFLILVEDYNNRKVESKILINNFMEVYILFLQNKDLTEAKEKLKYYVENIPKNLDTSTTFKLNKNSTKVLEKNNIILPEISDFLSNFIVDEKNFIDLFLINSILKLRLYFEKMRIFQNEINDVNFSLDKDQNFDKFLSKIYQNKKYKVAIPDDSLNSSHGENDQNDFINKETNKIIKIRNFSTLGKIKKKSIVFIVIPRSYIMKFIASLDENQIVMNKCLNDNVLINQTILKNIEKNKILNNKKKRSTIKEIQEKLENIDKSISNLLAKRGKLDAELIKILKSSKTETNNKEAISNKVNKRDIDNINNQDSNGNDSDITLNLK